MASADVTHDPLLLLRQSIASGTPCVPTKTADATSSESVDLSLATARYLQFTTPNHIALPLTTPTRWISASKPVDLRSIYYAYLKKDVPPRDYVVAAQALSEELKAAGGVGEVQTLDYVGQLDLVAWLEGASDESEHIKPLAADTANASASAQVTSGSAGGVAPVTSGSAGRQNKTLDPRLAEIYNGERRMGDRNSVLRGIKPTDFSHVRKLAHPFNARKAAQAAAANTSKVPTALPHNPKAPVRRPDPIVLLSPSASSLLRLSNIKSFLEGGTYIPPESSSFTSSSSADFLQITRVLPTIDQHPMRFIIADSAEKLKPEHWSRVVAVFTTGQVWQFKSYKWQNPPELFRHTLGVYLGWRGDHLPDTVKGWGRGVLCTQVEKYAAGASAASRWRDREVVESIWKAIEDGMRNKGWTRASGPSVM
ncbi:RNA pol II accessory factor, Cdc73 family-domain-containing protein [Tricladium varicosporioides]|nr:RNA pol II accessory factor, Cdc73 family-domain-containing protein [Hymenoscyphus varicosporioides]